eukprot:Skav216596  [mRNA]  locus=scaffold2855:57204:59252:+ [translate_table: standard]
MARAGCRRAFTGSLSRPGQYQQFLRQSGAGEGSEAMGTPGAPAMLAAEEMAHWLVADYQKYMDYKKFMDQYKGYQE